MAKEEQQPQRPGTAKPVANVILSTAVDKDDDDDDNFTVEESKPTVPLDDTPVSHYHHNMFLTLPQLFYCIFVRTLIINYLIM